MSNTIIRAALESRLATWAATQNLPVSYENVSYTKPADNSPFLECYLIPNTPVNKDIRGLRKTLLGLFQVNVWTNAGIGNQLRESIAQGLVDLFPLIPKFGDVSVEQTPTVGRATPDAAGWIITPVLIKYRYEAYD